MSRMTWTWPRSDEDSAPRTEVSITVEDQQVILSIDQGIEETVRVVMSPAQVGLLVRALGTALKEATP